MWGSVMQINDLLQCRAEQHNGCTPVHHSTSPVPPLQAGWKEKISSAHSWRVWEQELGSESVLLRGPAIHPFFLYTRQEDHDIRSALTKLERWRPELHQRLISLRWEEGEKRRGIDSVFCTVMHRQRIVTTQGRRWLQLYPTSLAQFIGGIFTYNWGSFHLACQQE